MQNTLWISPLHRIISIILLFSAIIIPQRWIFWVLTIILYSWLVFDGCIVNYLERTLGIPENGRTKGSMARMFGIESAEGKHKVALILNGIWYINYLILAFRVGLLPEGLLLMSIYFAINGRFESPSGS